MKFQKNQILLKKSQKIDALTRSNPSLFFSKSTPVTGYPAFVRKAIGCSITDIDGNEFIDFLSGYGSVILGHAHPEVDRSAISQIKQTGANPSLMCEVQYHLAEKLSNIIPNSESFIFLKTGSDATDAMVRLARTITKKQRVLNYGLGGWHDWSNHFKVGVPQESFNLRTNFSYNDLNDLEHKLRKHDDVACVVMMPYEIEKPQKGYLKGVRDLCDKYSVLLALDEVRSGFRISIGGAQEYFGVNADLVALSKAMGNGYPISVVGGRNELMKHVGELGLTITFYRSPISIAAALTTIQEIESTGAIDNISNLGEHLIKRFNQEMGENKLGARFVGFPQTPFLKFSQSKNTQSKLLSQFSNMMLSRGYIVPSNHHMFINNSMDLRTINDFVDEARLIVKVLTQDL